ncbi:MAG: hemolysin family protein [Hydrococcus sp. Prado102]|jgi:CBS domain containing-hemolysin-like protein|nr:hemolysin family protein [Hydrococcus sp. Prado102]
MTVPDILLRLLSVTILIAIDAFFVTAEFSIVSVRRSRISQLVEAGDIQAQTVQSFQRSIDRLLSATQLGITLSSLALGWISERTMAVLIKDLFARLSLSPEVSKAFSHGLAVPIAFFAIAYLQIVLGELCPKSVALLYSEQLARFLGPPMDAIARIFNPFIWILNQSTRFLLRLVGIKNSDSGWYTRVSSEELKIIIATEGETTGLEARERKLLQNVFEFGTTTASEVMIPRSQLIAIAQTATFETLLNEVNTTGHSRYPVKGESLDDLRGIIEFKDLAFPLVQGQLRSDTPIAPWIKPLHFVPETTPLSELLPLMQRSHLPMVIVVDEFGGTSGLVTLEDLIAEIIGDNPAAKNADALSIQAIDEQTYLVQAQMNLEEVNELLELNLPIADEYQTLGGFLLYKWQKIPDRGDTLIYENLELTVVSSEGPRLSLIRVHIRQPTPSESDFNNGISTNGYLWSENSPENHNDSEDNSKANSN